MLHYGPVNGWFQPLTADAARETVIVTIDRVTATDTAYDMAQRPGTCRRDGKNLPVRPGIRPESHSGRVMGRLAGMSAGPGSRQAAAAL